jgi:uncharacterized protein (DUF58 family)
VSAMTAQQIIHLGNLQFLAKTVVEGFMLGFHQSPFHGFSVEFSQHRPYQPGDDLRHIDWKVYGRSDRYYIRQYQEETNLRGTVLLDMSASMAYGSEKLTKFDFARILAASLIYLLTRQNDAVGLALFHSKVEKIFPPKAVLSYAHTMLAEMQRIEPKGSSELAGALHSIAEKLKRRGLAILISDLWCDPEPVFEGLKHLHYAGHDCLVLHVLDPDELKLPQGRQFRFIDLENEASLHLDIRQIQAAYSEKVSQFMDRYYRVCGDMGVDYLPVYTNQDLRLVLREYLIRRSRHF